MFPDDWGIGRMGRAKRARALSVCQGCPGQRDCALLALQAVEAGFPLYGIWGGIAFVDVCRQDDKIERLRAMVERTAAA
jgi:hypothetical protein